MCIVHIVVNSTAYLWPKSVNALPKHPQPHRLQWFIMSFYECQPAFNYERSASLRFAMYNILFSIFILLLSQFDNNETIGIIEFRMNYKPQLWLSLFPFSSFSMINSINIYTMIFKIAEMFESSNAHWILINWILWLYSLLVPRKWN